MDFFRQGKDRFVKWVEDIPGGTEGCYPYDPFNYSTRFEDDGREFPTPAWGGEPGPQALKLDTLETAEAEGCLPLGERGGRFGSNEELRQARDFTDEEDDNDEQYDTRLLALDSGAQQQRVWSFSVHSKEISTTSNPASKSNSANCRLHFCWHTHLPIFAVARPNVSLSGGSNATKNTAENWVVELYQIGKGESSAIPRAYEEYDTSATTNETSKASLLSGSIKVSGGGGKQGTNSDDGIQPFQLCLDATKGAVRQLAFQPHGGTNLLIGCTQSVWLAQFIMIEGDNGESEHDRDSSFENSASVSQSGYRVALVWLACVYHCPPLTTFSKKFSRRILGLGARVSPNFLQHMAWSPDGGRLAACFSGEQCLRLWKTDYLMARRESGAQPIHRKINVPLCPDGASTIAWSSNGSYLFAAHATGGLSTVWETENWTFHQWPADCSYACWAPQATGPMAGGRQILFTVQRAPFDASTQGLIMGGGTSGPGVSPAQAAQVQRQLGPHTQIRSYIFSADRPLCDHECHTQNLAGQGLLDISDEVARELLLEDFPPSSAETETDRAQRYSVIEELRKTQYKILDMAISSNATRLVVSHTTHRRIGKAPNATTASSCSPAAELLYKKYGKQYEGYSIAAVSIFHLILEPVVQVSYRKTLEWPGEGLKKRGSLASNLYVPLATNLPRISFFSRPTPIDGRLRPVHLLMAQAHEPMLNLLSFDIRAEDND